MSGNTTEGAEREWKALELELNPYGPQRVPLDTAIAEKHALYSPFGQRAPRRIAFQIQWIGTATGSTLRY